MVRATAERSPSIWKGAAAGLAAGLAASFAMDRFQSATRALAPDQAAEPATEQAADAISRAATGRPVPDGDKPAAGQAVHYGIGALLGIGYGIAVEYQPRVAAGFGTGFGGAVATVLDEAVVPAAGLAAAPTQTPLPTHAYGFASHAVFGGVAEAVRRIARAALGR